MSNFHDRDLSLTAAVLHSLFTYECHASLDDTTECEKTKCTVLYSLTPESSLWTSANINLETKRCGLRVCELFCCITHTHIKPITSIIPPPSKHIAPCWTLCWRITNRFSVFSSRWGCLMQRVRVDESQADVRRSSHSHHSPYGGT